MTAPPTPWQLPTATAFTEEVLYVYHWLDASSHPNGWVVQANAVDNGISYMVDLSGEPATGVLAFHHLHMDTNMAQQQVGFNLELGQGFQAQMRVRQYYNNSEDLFYDIVSWQNITTGGAQSLTINVDKNAVANAGKTILEVKFLPPRGQQTFPRNTTPIIDRPWLTNTTLVPENRVVTICDEKDQYRFGFNGQEKDNEVKGLGNSLDFGARIYDSRLGRWLSLDPLAAKYPNLSPYNFAGNNPIFFVDRDGKKIYIFYTDEKGNNTYYEYGSKLAVPNNAFVQQTVASLDYIKQVDATTQKVVTDLASTPKTLNILETKSGAFTMAAYIPIKDLNGNLIPPGTPVNPHNAMADEASLPFNPNAGLSDNSGNESISPATAMSHELSHVFSAFFSIKGYLNTLSIPEPNFHNYQEKSATEFEHRVAGFGGEWKRTDHKSGQEIITESPVSNRPIVTNEAQLGQGEQIILK